jgi:ubiquinone/menaquinone biosynthesis C-methylase UbiE
MSKALGPQLDPTIAKYYNTAPEEHRLAQSWSLLEALRTRELIERYAPKPPSVVLDIGGAAGAYALWLTELGYTVHLVDPVQRLVEEAQRRSEAGPKPLASTRVGDARTLDFPEQSADMVLLLGPLYHLIEAADRARALSEARRVLRPGGYLFAAAISRWASALDGLSRDLFQDRRFGAIVEQDLRDGQHRNPTDRLDYFTTAYFHHPDDLRTEVAGANLSLVGLYGLEGPGWILSDVPARLEDSRRRTDLLRVARLLESEPLMLGISAHLLVVARRT